MLKIILLSFVSLLTISGIGGYFYFKEKFKAPPNELELPETTVAIPFRWVSDSLGDELNPHAALLLPTLVPGCSRVFYTQFDLGAPTSIFYKNKIDAINERYNAMQIHEADGQTFLSQFSFQVGDGKVMAKKLSLRKYRESGIDWADSSGIEIIGTIGADIIENKVLIIDYPNQKITIRSSLTDSIKNKATLSSFKWKERRVLLPVNINGKNTNLYFDTGSSAFELLTSKSMFEDLKSKDADTKRFGVNSWGNTLWAYTSKTDHEVAIAGVNIPIKKVTHIEGTSMIQNLLMRFSGMGGMTGNKLFVEKVLVLDTQHQKFGIYSY